MCTWESWRSLGSEKGGWEATCSAGNEDVKCGMTIITSQMWQSLVAGDSGAKFQAWEILSCMDGEDLTPCSVVKQRERPHPTLLSSFPSPSGQNFSSLAKMETDPESSFTVSPNYPALLRASFRLFFPSQRPDMSNEAQGFLQSLLFAQESIQP